MNKSESNSDEMRSEYKWEDLGVGVRGKHYQLYMESHNLVMLRPEVAEAFPSEEAVNEALSALIRIAKASVLIKPDPAPQKNRRSGADI